MKVVYTDAALHDLDEMTVWLKAHYPGVGNAVERRLGSWSPISRAGRTACVRRRTVPAFASPRSGVIPIRFSIVSAATRWKYCTSTMRRANRGMSKHSVGYAA
jgi:hypothetical protein